MADPEPGSSTGASSTTYEDLSLSQLDPSVMSELPADILQEVQLHFNKKSPAENAEDKKSVFEEMKSSQVSNKNFCCLVGLCFMARLKNFISHSSKSSMIKMS